ncbi:MAG: tRNA (N(6)-L-threonylcarbamoyladenosine(37)-C(2))-methylthiotransferase [Candidatus Aenigmatarchaeota archaeon]
MSKAYLEVYGCSSNLADFEIASGLLKQAGFEMVNAEEFDLVVIFTCVVKQPTFNKMVHRIRELSKFGKPLIVAGCMTKTDASLIEKINPRASLLSPDNIEKIVEVANAAMKGERIVLTGDLKKPKLGFPRCRKNPLVAIVQIARGCTSNCSYCYEPYRGKLFSYPPKEIVKEVKRALNDGCKEIWLTSLDCGCYGLDIGTNLAELLREICKIEGKFFVRVGMANPLHVKKILGKLIKVYQDERIFKFLHLPLQSGSDRILKLMKRGYNTKDFLEIVEKFRKAFPQLTLSTDIIVGFPGETEEDFSATVKILREVKPDVVNLSKFGARKGTEASRMKQLEPKILNERSLKLSKIIKEISLEKNKSWVGWRGEALVDEIGKKESFVARNFAYKPIVLKTREKIFGKFVEVEVEEARENFLITKIQSLI